MLKIDLLMISNLSGSFGEDMWTQGLFISMYDRIDYK